MIAAAPIHVELQQASRWYPGDPPVAAVTAIDLSIRSGDHLAITGPSGSGKSTLLSVLGLLDRLTAGSHLVDGEQVTHLSNRSLAHQRATMLGFIFQAFHLIPHRSAIENVALALAYRGVPRSERRRRAADALDRVGLGHRTTFVPSQLSGGEQQRVAVARALASRPRLLLCDEPTGNLDSANTLRILDLLDSLRADGMAIVIATHDRAVSERAHRQLHLVDGRLSEQGPR